MPIPLILVCDPGQACHFSPTGRVQFGYLNALSISEHVLAPDILVAEPLVDQRTSEPGTPSVFQKSVVGVLEKVSWPSGRRSDSLSLVMLVSCKNSAILEMFLRQQQQTGSALAEFGLIVYSWDYQHDGFYVRFCTHTGSGSSSGAAGGGFASDARARGRTLQAVYQSGNVEENPVEDQSLGAILFRIELSLCPTAREQKFRIATSQSGNALLSWGEPVDGDAQAVLDSQDA